MPRHMLKPAIGIASFLLLLLPSLQAQAGCVETIGREDAPGPFEGKTILIVDDHSTDRELSSRIFKIWGFARTLQAASAREALTMLDGVDVILTDVQMPEMSGIEFTRQVKASLPGLPILMNSADKIPTEERGGADAFVQKGSDYEDYRKALTDILRKSAESGI